ncbi:MAG: hypothetical protein NT051_05595 [Candidatus Micrarchaeota archaeon]|nr:hypothetical protein [Candidatus Micrarchaeota archaeon]
MEYVQAVGSLQTSATGLVGGLLGGIAAFCIFVIVMACGLFVANLLGDILRRFMKEARIEKLLEGHGVHDAFLGFTFTNITVTILKLYVVVIFLGIASGVIDVPMLYMLSVQAANYMPMLVQGIVILLAGLMIGDYLTDKMKTAKGVPFANTLAILVEIFIVYNVLVIVMPLLLPAVDPSLLASSFLVVLIALCFSLGLGFAIAIGLGLKDTVSTIAKKHGNKIEKLL